MGFWSVTKEGQVQGDSIDLPGLMQDVRAPPAGHIGGNFCFIDDADEAARLMGCIERLVGNAKCDTTVILCAFRVVV